MPTQDEIKARIRIEPWSEIRSQLKNEKLFNLNYQANFLQVALALAEDDEQTLRHYLTNGALRRPPQAQVDKWDKTPDKSFQLVIVEGYILFQEIVGKKKY